MHLDLSVTPVKYKIKIQPATVQGFLVHNELFQYPILGSEKYQNELPTPKYVLYVA